jgi:Lipocalin-like domain
MKRIFVILYICISLNISFAQKAKVNVQKELVGTWTLVSIDNIYPDNTRIHPYGENPKGLLMFDAAGNYAIQILKAVRPKIISGDKNKCTPEENAVIVQGTNSHFGKYEVDEKDKVIIFKIAWASFPNWEGTVQKRSYNYTSTQIKYVVTNTTQGGVQVMAEVVWEKL